MAKFEEVLPALREGKKIRRKEWNEFGLSIQYSFGKIVTDKNKDYLFSTTEILADDWEIVEEPKKKKKVVYYQALYLSNANCKEFFLSNELFKNADKAINQYENTFYPHKFIRLLTEYPIEIEEEE